MCPLTTSTPKRPTFLTSDLAAGAESHSVPVILYNTNSQLFFPPRLSESELSTIKPRTLSHAHASKIVLSHQLSSKYVSRGTFILDGPLTSNRILPLEVPAGSPANHRHRGRTMMVLSVVSFTRSATGPSASSTKMTEIFPQCVHLDPIFLRMNIS
jgi:hypothetical protein